MNKLAAIFPGQGIQKVGMCSKLAEQSSASRLVFEEVDDALSMKLSKVIFEGPEDALNLTENTQPALMACSIALLRALEKASGKQLKEFCSYLAGHSLGEFTALVAASSLSLRDCARLLKIRGRAMQDAPKGGMFALLGANAEIAAQIASDSGVELANDNAPTQQVLSGHVDAIDAAMQMASAAGYKVIKLNVGGAFHSKLMESAKDLIEEALNGIPFLPPEIPIIANVSGEIMPKDLSAIKDALIKQVTGTVQWCKSMKTLVAFGVETIIEIGPGTVCTNLVKRIDPDIKALALQDMESINFFSEKHF